MGFSLYNGRATWDAAGKSSSGSTTTLPTVTVTASDANASEANRDPGVFTIARTGSTSASLTVNYTLGGTAANGADYNALSGAVTIPAGAASATVTITPVDDALVEGSETVVLSVAANAAYTVGSPASATVTITDNDSAPTADTTAPTVSLTAPANGATVSGSSVMVSANASDNVGVAGVQFKLDGANLGAEDSSASYSVSWNTTSIANGTHTLTAVARDAAGNQTTSTALTVTVGNSSTTPTNPTNPTTPTNPGTPSGVVWMDDAVPAWAQFVAGYGNEAWPWVGSSPTP